MKENQIKLARDKNLQSSIINHITDHFIFWKDIEGVYLGCNEAFAHSLGFKSPQEVIGKTDYDFPVKKEDSDAYRADDKEVMSSQKPKLNIEEPQTLASGETRMLLTSKVPLIDEENKVYGVLAIYSDITEMKKMEKEAVELRVEKVAAEERIETIRLMGMSVAHELRTPLRAISSGAHGTLNKLSTLIAVFKKATELGIEIPEGYPELYPRDITLLERVLKNIELEAQAAFSVIDMLLIKGNLSKINKDKFTNCRLSTCINNSLARYPFKPGEEKLIECKDGDFTFHGDTLLVVHVLFNLIKNALYYVKRAGKGSIIIWIENGSNNNKLHFKDTGTGISPDNLPHMFEQFFSTESNGTGIGLAFCKLVMQSMDGGIECFSELGEYTEFILTFPKLQMAI
jgi:PAS domain S-box-containing protein